MTYADMQSALVEANATGRNEGKELRKIIANAVNYHIIAIRETVSDVERADLEQAYVNGVIAYLTGYYSVK